MKENKAKTKWCPFVRVSWTEPGKGIVPINRLRLQALKASDFEELTPIFRCIGTECAVWISDRDELDEKTGELTIYGHCGMINGNVYG